VTGLGRRANADDAGVVAAILGAAFMEDPVWGDWACPDVRRRSEQLTAIWRFFVDASLPTGWVWITDGGEAASLWVPPGVPDIPPEYEERLHPFLIELLGTHGDLVYRGMEIFEATRPDAPHYYLSLLATHPRHRGRGHGMALLADNLRVVDEAGMPAYLESTNPANNARYERVGFVLRGGFQLPEGPAVATMWRDVPPGPSST
jgi:GNAT superfamily N-acetyltransferase